MDRGTSLRSRFLRNVSRRELLHVLASSAGGAAGLRLSNQSPARTAAHEHGLVQIAAAPEAFTPRFFDARQMQMLSELVEIIIPTDEHSPGGKAARVPEYIDEVSADAGEEEKRLWTDGLEVLDHMARREVGKDFVACSAVEQTALVEKISRNEDHPTTVAERFFRALKEATIKGYYTSEIGIHEDLQYVGNTYLEDFPGCTHPEHTGQAHDTSGQE